MKTIFITNSQDSLNRIESFVEDICDGLNISNTFLGNMLIAISELVNVIEVQNSGARINFFHETNRFKFEFDELNEDFKLDFDRKSFSKDAQQLPNIEDSMFMINALCDDLTFDEKNRKIVLTFINAGVDEVVSKHRKDYLSNYLNQQVKVK